MSGRSLPILYSFRRCPYAIRARFALKYSGIKCLLREVRLANKPQSLLNASAKATVPVLILPSGQILEESLHIIHWALEQNDPKGLGMITSTQKDLSAQLIANNDLDFVNVLHRFKYPNHYHAQDLVNTQDEMNAYLSKLETMLNANNFLIGNTPKIVDLAIFPFIRQRARIDEQQFRTLPFPKLISWLDFFMNHEAYNLSMIKVPLWVEGSTEGEIF